ncbi:MAG: hypothetical protein LBS03_03565 [Bacteroidales bacterium]|jgi:hypothetical protein|nr:hypothetical protein [Bacteroidales bacterium]
MNDRQESKLAMYQKVLDTCKKYASVYADVPAFGQAVAQLDGNIAGIVRKAQEQSLAVSKGDTVEKGNAFERLVQLTVTTAKAICVYAFKTGNPVLLSRTTLNKSTLYDKHAMDVVITAKNIAEEAAAHAAELPFYGIDDRHRNALAESIAQCELLLNKPAQTRDERKLYTGTLKELFAAADSTLYDELDLLIDLFRDAAPDFFTLYKSARNVIYPTGGRKKAGKSEN